MAVLQKIREFFIPLAEDTVAVVPAPATTYEIKTLTINHLKEVWKLNQRCFVNGENYPRYTLSYLLTEPNTLSYCTVAANGTMVGFIFISVQDGTGHITTIGVSPEHRRRGLAHELLTFAENKLRMRQVGMICLEVRVSNETAQNLYRQLNYSVMQRLTKYYSDGEDGFLMVKPLI